MGIDINWDTDLTIANTGSMEILEIDRAVGAQSYTGRLTFRLSNAGVHGAATLSIAGDGKVISAGPSTSSAGLGLTLTAGSDDTFSKTRRIMGQNVSPSGHASFDLVAVFAGDSGDAFYEIVVQNADGATNPIVYHAIVTGKSKSTLTFALAVT